MALPQIGEVHDGYRYAGGDPNTKASWQFVGNQVAQPQAMSGAPGSQYMAPSAAPKLDQTSYKSLAALRDQATSAMGARSDANRFRSLNAQDKTGGIGGLPIARDIRAMFDPQVAEMKAITEKLTPAQRAPGSGAMSDGDAAMYRAATVGLDKPEATNTAMAHVISAGALRQADQSAFFEEYAKRNGSILGAGEAWNAYANANPLFENRGGNTTIRGWTPWRQWFGLEQGAQQPQATSPAPAQGQPRVFHYDAQGRRVQ